ncbi:protein tiptop [Anopheles nili]|uniref:protein tiptop n=1 Tax=Anopheles nili TaxID=185578 RepID=UPI00237B8845|nr:protein tiptop [Anopheles nili]
MMLHEAVMLEIYRQALHASEMASPRCQSRESSSGGGRCPSDESIRSEGDREEQGAGSALSPVSITLPPTLPPAAAAALLPQHSAAMAAYLNVAAVAAQQNRLLLGSPLAAGLASVRNGSPPGLPLRSPTDESDDATGGVLDFSKKRSDEDDDDEDEDDEDARGGHRDDGGGGGGGGTGDDGDGGSECGDAVNLSQKGSVGGLGDNSSPLDLSVGAHRKRTGHEEAASPPPRKTTRSLDYKPAIVTPWSTPVTPQLPYLAAVAQGLSPKGTHQMHQQHQQQHQQHQQQQQGLGDTGWNGKQKTAGIANDATKALEKMSELSRLGGEDIYRPPGGGGGGAGGGGSGGRHSAWQSHWLNKGADSAKDVLKCVWCKQSFPSLAAMTTHMKETKHCGVSVPPGGGGGGGGGGGPGGPGQQPMPPQSGGPGQGPGSGGNSGNQSKPTPSELNMLIKETMPLPRKLVRGQDVWLGKGAEQTRQILKCMWCGQSFRTLAEMTAHMQQTQHYTNIISQEQIISWKSSDSDKGTGGGGTGGGTGGGGASGGSAGPSGPPGQPGAGGPGGANAPTSASAAAAAQTNSHVSAVLTCKVCDQAFSSLKELSNHMVKNAHYKEHIMRSITESGSRRRQTREKRKKSLPVRKLLEMERAQHDPFGGKNGATDGVGAAAAAVLNAANKPLRDLGAGRISCEKCGEKIETTLFVDHIRQCIGGTALLAAQQQRDKLKSALLANAILPPDSLSPGASTGRKSACQDDPSGSPLSAQKSPLTADLLSPVALLAKKDTVGGANAGDKSSSPSVLNAIEQLIEKSFDTRSRHGGGGSNYGGGGSGGGGAGAGGGGGGQSSTPLGSSILKRLGIDESVDYTKPLVDPQTMSLLRSYHHHQQQQQQQHQQQYGSQHQQQYGRRERSGSESSSISERGSSRLDSLTPDKKFDTPSHSTPRGTPDKPFGEQIGEGHASGHELTDLPPIKRELHSDDEEPARTPVVAPGRIRIKKELVQDPMDHDGRDSPDQEMRPPSKDDREDGGRRASVASSPAPSPRLSTASVPLSPAASPLSDHHSIASRSTPGAADLPKKPSSSTGSSSLGALSSMFDSLTGAGSGAGGSEGPGGATSGTPGGKKSSAHPLAALQKLCDKTETPSPGGANGGGAGGGRSGGSSSAALLATTAAGSGGSRTAPGAILAFSWACNEAVLSEDVAGGAIKCAYCDTTFGSKGAYRHHLSKAHFVSDDVIPDPKVPASGAQSLKTRASPAPHSPKSTGSTAPLALVTTSSASSSSSSSSGGGGGGGRDSVERREAGNGPSTKSPPPAQSPAFDESPHSKFLKYTELAKQLSSKYV